MFESTRLFLETESQNSPWRKIHPTFTIKTFWTFGELGKGSHKNKLYNRIRKISIDNIDYFEVETQKPEMTFLIDIKNYGIMKKYTWYNHKAGNIFYIETNDKDNNYKILKLHHLICPEWKIIDHINRNGLDNRECNLRKTSARENGMNCKLRKHNSSGYNGISFDKFSKYWGFHWIENNKHKVKKFCITKNRTSEQAKKLAIDFKITHDKITENLNGKEVF
ncbi:8279_t:CDS:1 [Racocetra fulgida]|uniref:8279_t:CDS:1 n=1 Tax=Racocetra fulgida TaxID=60492 RepID=A0A9N9EUX2_9GLOM|nr:8279_t:CDS:1 [Racocetra fulgida]